MEREHQSRYRIREATLDDVAETRALHAESWLATYPSDEHGVSREWVEERVGQWLTPEKLAFSQEHIAKILADKSQFYRVATDGDRIVGFVHAKVNPDQSSTLKGIYTHPDTFGSGLGDKLMAEADTWLDGAPSTLEVASYNQRAIRFYQKHGYEIVDGTEDMFAEKIPIITMSRPGKDKGVSDEI